MHGILCYIQRCHGPVNSLSVKWDLYHWVCKNSKYVGYYWVLINVKVTENKGSPHVIQQLLLETSKSHRYLSCIVDTLGLLKVSPVVFQCFISIFVCNIFLFKLRMF